MNAYDLVVVGAGPGGYVAALRAARLGARVCLVERERLGGTCLHRGCIPTKALHATARQLSALRSAAEHGINISGLDFDPIRALARKDAVVKRLEQGIATLVKQAGIDLFHGDASLVGGGRLRVERPGMSGLIRARAIVLATGSRPVRPKFLEQADKNVLTSDEILVMQNLPSSLLVLGGGYIGCELAGILARFGVKVTLVEQRPQLLENQDADGVRLVTQGLQRLGVEILTGTTLQQVKNDTGVHATFADGRSLRFDKVLASVGRVPNTEGLMLSEAGVALEGGAVQVDDNMQTSLPGVYAIGDLTGSVMLAHVAMHHAERAVAHILGVSGPMRGIDQQVPSVVFTQPELAQVGESEAACRSRGQAVKIGRFSFQASGKALCDGAGEGMVKLIADAQDGKLLGAMIVGEDAATLIAEVATAIGSGITARQLATIVHAHPTLSEIVQEAARDLDNEAIHKPFKMDAG
ncbi:MAG: dihydrolipoyl dehydrogenase [Pedobacter sp.]